MVAPPIRDGAVAVDGGRVAWVGPRADAPPGDVTDLGEGVLLPGFVNAHCHLELTHLQDLDRTGGFVPWVDRLIEQRSARGDAASLEGARRGLALIEAATGTAAVGDVSNALLHLDLLAASRLHAVVFYELLGWDPQRAGAILAAADERLGAVQAGLDVRLSAHAPHSVSPALFAGLRERGGPAFLHLAESPAETRFLLDGDGPWSAFLAARVGHVPFAPPRLSPVRYADHLGVLRPGLAAAHCVHVDDGDRRLLAERGVGAVLCPSSNRNLGVGLPDLPALLASGVALAIGTDSLASGDSLDVRDEAVLLRRTYPSVPAEALVRMLTLGGALVLGLGHLGAIAPGRAAALAFVAGAAGDPHDAVLAPDAAVARAV